MPTAAEIRQAVNDRLTALLPQIRTRQNAYFAARGRFFQLIRTVDLPPADGTETAPDLTRRPHYQAESAADIGLNLGATLPMQVEIHQYLSPRGPGWLAILTVKIGAQVYQRVYDDGPEGRDQAWGQVTPL